MNTIQLITMIILIIALIIDLLFRIKDLRDDYNCHYMSCLRVEIELLLSVVTAKGKITEENQEWMDAVIYLKDYICKSFDYIYDRQNNLFFWVSEKKLEKLVAPENWKIIKDIMLDRVENKEAVYSHNKKMYAIDKIENLHFV